MKNKKLIERNLKFSGKYVYLGIVKGSILDGQCTTCDNCGALIANMVNVVDKATGKRYTIGTDCAETLSQANCLYNNGTQTDYYNDLFTLNEVCRFVSELKNGCELQNDGFMCSLVNRKGKSVTIFTHNLEKYFPEYVK